MGSHIGFVLSLLLQRKNERKETAIKDSDDGGRLSIELYYCCAAGLRNLSYCYFILRAFPNCKLSTVNYPHTAACPCYLLLFPNCQLPTAIASCSIPFSMAAITCAWVGISVWVWRMKRWSCLSAGMAGYSWCFCRRQASAMRRRRRWRCTEPRHFFLGTEKPACTGEALASGRGTVW